MRNLFLIAIAATCLIATTAIPAAAAEASSGRKDIYDEKADAKVLIANAVKKAKEENKRVLITWGGNWCGWCHLLNDTFNNNEEINSFLKENFVRVKIDTNTNRELMSEMKIKTEGVPYLTVLDSSGKKVMDQATGPLEVGRAHDPKKVMAFLKKAQPKAKSS
jgi:thioredoxin-related protein